MSGCLVLLIALGVPVFDGWLLFRIGDRIGGLQTFAFVLLSMFLGLALARRQRETAVASMHAQLAGGQLPTAAMADGPMLMLASVLFALPGFLTDALGYLLLIPPVRRAMFALVARSFMRAAREGRVNVRMFGGSFGAGGGFGAGGPAVGERGAEDVGAGDATGGPRIAGPDAGGGTFAPGSFEAAREIKELPPESYRVRDADGGS